MNTSESIVIVGGAGMLAKAFVRKLAAWGITPAVVSRADLDVTDTAAVDGAMEKFKPSILLNCSAYTKVDLAEQESAQADAVNGTAVGILAAACKRVGARFVHFSTDFVFNGRSTRPYRTDDPTEPLSAYGRSKLLGEQQFAEHADAARSLLIRTAWLYGPGGPSFPRTMVNAARDGKPLTVVADQTGAPTFTFDLADATLDLLDRGAAGVFHGTNSGQTNWFEFTRAIMEEFGMKDHPVSATTAAEWFKIRPTSATRPAYSVLDVSKTEAALGRPMRPWRDGLREYRQAVDAEGI